MEPVVSQKEKDSAEKQRRIVNESYAVIRRKTIKNSLRTLLKLVEKNQ